MDKLLKTRLMGCGKSLISLIVLTVTLLIVSVAVCFLVDRLLCENSLDLKNILFSVIIGVSSGITATLIVYYIQQQKDAKAILNLLQRKLKSIIERMGDNSISVKTCRDFKKELDSIREEFYWNDNLLSSITTRTAINAFRKKFDQLLKDMNCKDEGDLLDFNSLKDLLDAI